MTTNLLQHACLLGSPKIMVLGDLVLDYYTWGNVERISPEAPVMILRGDLREARLGGAASVAYLARQLGAQVTIAGVVGSDSAARTLTTLLGESGIDYELVYSAPGRQTTTKERLIGRASSRHPHQILRVDHEVVEVIDRHLQELLADGISAKLQDHQVLLISDYDKGVCTSFLLSAVLTTAAEFGIPVVVDPARLTSYERYRFADIITPNRREAELAAGCTVRSPSDALVAGKQLSDRYGFDAVLVTLDADGIALYERGSRSDLFGTRARSVYDVTGAGDTVLATLGVCIASAVPLAEAVHIANVAAGLQVEKLGVAAVTRQEVIEDLFSQARTERAKLIELEPLTVWAHAYHSTGRRIVFTNGCFDLLHVGHLRYLQEAARLGDVLVVAVNSNEIVRQLKGPGRPVIDEQDRAALVAALNCVDHVLVFREPTPHRLLRLLRPDVLVKGGDYLPDEVVGREILDSYGGQVCTTGCVPGISTTGIVATIRASATA